MESRLLLSSLIVIVTHFVMTTRSQNDIETGECECMEYWDCMMSSGYIFSYCDGSGKVCCFKGSTHLGIVPRPQKIGRCGQKGPDSVLRGESSAGEYPWHTALLEKPQDLYVCGASLVDETWVLTAAHCVDDFRYNPGRLKARLGEHDVSRLSERFRHEEFDVSKVVLHDGFDNATLLHDIALVKLAKPAKRKPHIDLVCMPPDDMAEESVIEKDCFITGWGRRFEGAPHSTVLKEVDVPIWKRTDCQRSLQKLFGDNFRLPETNLCAGANGKDACDGDGGSPLVCKMDDNRWIQVGIVSFGIGCGRPDTPGVYTRVDKYKNWIHSTVLTN